MQKLFSVHSIIFAGMILFLARPVSSLFAQQLDFDEIKVIAPYEPTISDAFKMNFNPRLDDTLQIDISFDYSINPVQIPTRFSLEPLSPARMRGEPLAKLYNGFVKAGLGNYATPYGEVFYNSLRSNEYAYGVHLKHISSGGGIDDYGHSGYSDNKIHLNGKRFLRNHTIEGDLNYERNMMHFYGFKRDDYNEDLGMLQYIDELSNKDIRQVFHYISPAMGFRSNYLDPTRLQHDLNLKYHFLTDSYDATEHRLEFLTTLEKSIVEDPLGFADNQSFQIDFGTDYFHNKTATDTINSGLIKIAPSIMAQIGDFSFRVGLNASFQLDSTGHARFYPIAAAELNLIDNRLFAFATFDGEVQKNTLRDISLVNPFVNTNSPLAFTNKKHELRGGLKGSISSFASFNLAVSTSSWEDYALFVTDTSQILNNQFNIIYDDMRMFNFRAELFGNVGERLKLRLGADYYEYTLENEFEAWHMPTLKLSLSAKYNMQDKIILNAGAFGRNSTYARVFDDEGNVSRREIQGFHVDLSFGIEYRYTKILSVFINLNNVSNQPLERWFNYPSQRINLMGGVSYAF
ncbi:MAG: hypothetical protein K0B37_00515 [Bacteroidales bacterium]|nr:hypothetical protein [Bacteroidales bacterium]